jgi:hypothetical protein
MFWAVATPLSCRCNALDLRSALGTMCSTLLEADLALPLLPMTVLWEHLASHVVPRTDAAVLARVVRVRALCSLGILAPAADILVALIKGRGLPGALFPALKPLSEMYDRVQRPRYDASRWPSHADNAACIAFICDAELPSGVADVYGPWLSGQVVLARAKWLAAAGAEPDCWQCGGHPTTNATTTINNNNNTINSNSNSNSNISGSSLQCSGRPATTTTTTTVNTNNTNATTAISSKGSNKNAIGGGGAGNNSSASPPAAPAGATQESQHLQPGAAASAGGSSIKSTIEGRMLEVAVQLLRGVITTSRSALGLAPLPGLDWDATPHGSTTSTVLAAAAAAAASPAFASNGSEPPSRAKLGSAAAVAQKKTNKGAKDNKARAGAAGSTAQVARQGPTSTSAVPDAAQSTMDTAAAAEALCAAQHRQLLIASLQQLVHVEQLRWQPRAALPVALAACDTLAVFAASGASVKGASTRQVGADDADSVALRPTLWLSLRCQVGNWLCCGHDAYSSGII